MRLKILSKIFAILLIALAVSPVTAPFVSCDVTATPNLHEFVMSAGKVVEEVPVLAPGLTLVASTERLMAINCAGDADILPSISSCSLVLRL